MSMSESVRRKKKLRFDIKEYVFWPSITQFRLPAFLFAMVPSLCSTVVFVLNQLYGLLICYSNCKRDRNLYPVDDVPEANQRRRILDGGHRGAQRHRAQLNALQGEHMRLDALHTRGAGHAANLCVLWSNVSIGIKRMMQLQYTYT
jgi:hypothetical protein